MAFACNTQEGERHAPMIARPIFSLSLLCSYGVQKGMKKKGQPPRIRKRTTYLTAFVMVFTVFCNRRVLHTVRKFVQQGKVGPPSLDFFRIIPVAFLPPANPFFFTGSMLAFSLLDIKPGCRGCVFHNFYGASEGLFSSNADLRPSHGVG